MEKTTEQPAVARRINHIFVHLAKIIRLFRLIDAAVFTGIPVAGILIAAYHSSGIQIEYSNVLIFILAVYMLALHVFLINDWYDYKNDRNDPGKDLLPVSSKFIFAMALLSGLFSLAILLSFSSFSFFIGLLLLLLSLAYSTSVFCFHGKAVCILASLLHLAGGLLAFLLGYLFVGFYSTDVLVAGLMLGTFLSAGHLFQEIQDVQGDALSHINTVAKLMGVVKSTILGLALLLSGHVFFQYLINTGFLPEVTVGNWAAFALVALSIGNKHRNTLTRHSIKHFRNQYRIVYAALGLYIFIKIFFQI